MTAELREGLALRLNEYDVGESRRRQHLATLERVPPGAELVATGYSLGDALDQKRPPEEWAYSAMRRFGLVSLAHNKKTKLPF